ncbi:MAG: replication initiator [Egibacteraceae bacterium]
MTSVIDMGSALAQILARGEDAAAIQDQARQVGGCEQPIRLRGRIDTLDRQTGELSLLWSSEAMPDGVVHTRCNNRRASRCEPCSRLYQGDAWQLIVAGLTGGKGVPDTIREHPKLFVTLTAPSFGPVHTRATDSNGKVAPCRARRNEAGEICEHGRPVTCTSRHGEDDPELGRPLCVDCWDYAGAVLWNAHASELWRRTRIRVYRELAALVGISERALKRQVSVQYVKVAEYQKRGLVHFHLLIRLDASRSQREEPCEPPPEHYTAELLAQAVRNAVTHVEVPYPDHLFLSAGQGPQAFPQGKWRQPPLTRADPTTLGTGDPGTGALTQQARRLPDVSLTAEVACARWGCRLDVREVQAEERHKIAGYLAKYATKHTECVGGLDRPVKVQDLDVLPVSEHVRRLVLVAWRLALRDSTLRTDRWAHQFGYGGHFLTKSRHYSTTFTALRIARAQWAASQRPPSREVEGEVLVKRWEVAGFGWRMSGDALLARTVREQARAQREAAREARAELNEVLALAG